MAIVRTIEIPEELAARLEALPQARADFNAFAVALFEQAAGAKESQELAAETAGLAELRPYADYGNRAAYLADAREKAQQHGGDPDLVESLAAGLADASEGRDVSLEEWSAQMDSRIAARLAEARAREARSGQ